MLGIGNYLKELKTYLTTINNNVSNVGSNVTTLQSTATPTRNKIQVFTSSGTWVKPANTTVVDLFLVGAGGNGHFWNGGGGSGYFLNLKNIPVTGNTTVTIGATSGASTSFGIYTASGGDGGGEKTGGSGYSGGGGYGGYGGYRGSNGGYGGYSSYTGLGITNIAQTDAARIPHNTTDVNFGSGGIGYGEAGGGGGGIIIHSVITGGTRAGIGYGAGGGAGGGVVGGVVAGVQGICIVTWFE